MAEFSFYASDEDRLAILSRILEGSEYTFIGGLSYPTPEPEVFKEVSQALLASIAINRGLFVQGPYSLNPPAMRQLTGGKYDGEYYVEDIQGGPLIQLSLPGESTDDGIRLIPGSLFLPQRFYQPDGTLFAPSEEIKTHYKKLVSLLKRDLSKKSLDGPLWIGKDGWEKFQRGEAKILRNGKWLGVPV